MKLELSRRSVLRSGAFCLSLPFLEAMLPRRGEALAQGTQNRFVVFIFQPVGIYRRERNGIRNWVTQPGSLSNVELPWLLSPLNNVKGSINLYSGLNLSVAEGGPDGAGDHARSAGTFLTATRILKTENNYRAAKSIDLVIADELQSPGTHKNLVLSLHGGGNSGGCDSGYACAYSNNISWTSPEVPSDRSNDPSALFRRLFGNGGSGGSAPPPGPKTEGYVLDAVRSQAVELKKSLGKSDQSRLDEYLTQVGELQRRIQAADDQSQSAAAQCMNPAPPSENRNYELDLKNMYALIELALLCGKTRVISFMLDSEGTGRQYGWLRLPPDHPDGQSTITRGYHDMSHFGQDRAALDGCRAIHHWHLGQFASFVQSLAAKTGADGKSMLDSGIVLLGSGIEDSDAHEHSNLPIITAGSGGGLIRMGQHNVANNAPLASLYLTMASSMGVNLNRFGDADEKLKLS